MAAPVLDLQTTACTALALRGASRSRSPPDHRRHQCHIALTEEQYEEIQRTHVVPRAWFGDRHDCVPVKNSIEKAVAVWQEAMVRDQVPQGAGYQSPWGEQEGAGQVPPFVLTFNLSWGRFHWWINSETMKKCNPRGAGYRIYQDVNLAEVDPLYSVHPIGDWDDPRLPAAPGLLIGGGLARGYRPPTYRPWLRSG